MAKRKKIEPGQKIDVPISHREKELILEHVYPDPELAAPLNVLLVKGKKLIAKYTLDDLDLLLEDIEIESQYTPDKKVQKELDSLFSRLQKIMESYDDGGWQDSP